jgi:RHS repeat-associated protein
LLSPADGGTVRAPLTVTGTVSGPLLRDYTLSLRSLIPGEASAWRPIATGPAGVTAGPLGTLDPTLLENGPYELRLSATQWDGGTLTTDPLSLLLDGNMKIGHFALAFQDLSVQLPGLGINLTRSYDSRRTDIADFGQSWDLAISSMRLLKNRPLGNGYVMDSSTSTPAGTLINLPLFRAIAPSRKLVTLVLPDGSALAFQPRLEVHPTVRIYSPSSDSSIVPQDQVKLTFVPFGKTTGTLEPIDPPATIAYPQYNDGPYGLGASQPGVVRLQGGILSKGLPGFDPTYEPTRFKYTSPEGLSFLIEENKGVLQMEDRNDNTLTFTDTAITHSNGMAVTFTRDASKRVTAITDPAGLQLLYTYDSTGRLTHFTDRTGAVTTYKYENPAYPHYLTEIIDPLGNRAVKTLFDPEGRLIGQVDADGHTASMTHDLTAYKETITDRLGHPTVHEYDENGNIIKTTDSLGGITTRTYDARDRELTVTDPLGHTTSKTYDEADNVLTETNPAGETTTYTYNDKKQPLSITDPLGHSTAFSYDANGNTTSITDPTGRSTSFTYDGNGSVTSLIMPGDTAYHFTLDPASGEKLSQTIIGADGQISAHQTFTYDANGEQTGTTDYLVPPGATDVTAATVVKTTAQVFDPEGRMTSMAIKDAAGNPMVTQSWTYNANGDELTHTDPLGRVTSSEYDSQGRDFRTTHPDGTTSLLVYDANGEITATTNRSGHLMTYEIDALGRQTKATNLADGTFTTTVYDAAGRETSKTDELGRTTTMAYDEANRLITSTDPAGNIISMTYDDAGRQITETNADGHTTTTEYDAAGRPVKSIAPDGTISQMAYDSAGRITGETDPMGYTTQRSYDAQGRLLKVTNAAGSETKMEFDSVGRPLRTIDALGRVTSYTTDSLGRRTSRTLPGGQTETMTWQNALQLASRTDFNGYTTTLTYDADGNLLEKVADPAHPSLSLPHATAKVRYTYNSFDLPATAETLTTGGSVLTSRTFTYDTLGRLMAVAGPGGTLTYTRDAQDRITGVSSNNAGGVNLTYGYNTAGQLSTVTDHRPTMPRLHQFTWTPSGALGSAESANGLKHHYTRDTQQRVTGLSIADAANNVIETFGHSYNAAGRRTTSVEGSGRSLSYAYNNLHRLRSESISTVGVPPSGGLPNTPGTLGYTIDAVGNRLNRTSDLATPAPGNQTFSYNANDELAGVTYDLNGNPTSSNGNTDIYDFEDRLIRRTRNDGTVIDLTYDAYGNRVRKAVTPPGQLTKSTTYLIDSAAANGWPQCVEEHVSLNGQPAGLTSTFTYGPHGPISQQTAGSLEVDFLLDAHGSVRALTDATGQILSATDYDAYGIPLASAGTTTTLGYNGEYYDTDLGLIYLRARFYDPTTGRFLNRDPYQGAFQDPQSLHAYHFTANDPVNGIDPSGNFSLFELTATQLLQKFTENAQVFLRADKISDNAIKTMVPIVLAFNYAASHYSVYENASQGKGPQWMWHEIALWQALPYQKQLLNDFENDVDRSKDPVESARRWRAIVRHMNSGLNGALPRREQKRLGVANKMNGFPELTPHTPVFRGTVFIKLEGTRDQDEIRAQLLSPIGMKTGTWHHHEVVGIMQNVDSTMHAFYHYGGASIYDALKGTSGYKNIKK